MGIVFDGDGDVNVTGVVGSTEPDYQNWDFAWDASRSSSGETETLEGIHHYGHGEVWVNDKQVHDDAAGS